MQSRPEELTLDDFVKLHNLIEKPSGQQNLSPWSSGDVIQIGNWEKKKSYDLQMGKPKWSKVSNYPLEAQTTSGSRRQVQPEKLFRVRRCTSSQFIEQNLSRSSREE